MTALDEQGQLAAHRADCSIDDTAAISRFVARLPVSDSLSHAIA
jgi:hypothetical protein